MAKRKITNQSRDFKGVWIPAEYWLDPNLMSKHTQTVRPIYARGEYVGTTD